MTLALVIVCVAVGAVAGLLLRPWLDAHTGIDDSEPPEPPPAGPPPTTRR